MNFKEYLMELKWNDFSTYPKQGEPIYLNCISTTKRRVCKFLKVNNFNAITFDPRVIMKDYDLSMNWIFFWLPLYEINEF